MTNTLAAYVSPMLTYESRTRQRDRRTDGRAATVFSLLERLHKNSKKYECIAIYEKINRIDEPTWLAKTRMSSLNDSDEQTSPPAIPGSRGVHVASSHFSNINASNGNNG